MSPMSTLPPVGMGPDSGAGAGAAGVGAAGVGVGATATSGAGPASATLPVVDSVVTFVFVGAAPAQPQITAHAPDAMAPTMAADAARLQLSPIAPIAHLPENFGALFSAKAASASLRSALVRVLS